MSEERDLTQVEPDDLTFLVEEAARRGDTKDGKVALHRQIKMVALGATDQADWVDIDGKPWLQASGAEKVKNLFPIGWQLEEPKKEFYEDGHYYFAVKGTFWLQLRGDQRISIEWEGSRNSRDPFFTTFYEWDPDSNKKVKKLRKPDEVSATNVRKSAISNCIGGGVCRLLGLRNLSWEELGRFGISSSKGYTHKSNKDESSAHSPTERRLDPIDDSGAPTFKEWTIAGKKYRFSSVGSCPGCQKPRVRIADSHGKCYECLRKQLTGK